MEVFLLNTSGAALGPEIERVCLDNELVIATWSPIHLRTKLKELYWKADKPAVKAADFWEDTLRYLYLPRLKDRACWRRPSSKVLERVTSSAPPTANRATPMRDSSSEIPTFSSMTPSSDRSGNCKGVRGSTPGDFACPGSPGTYPARIDPAWPNPSGFRSSAFNTKKQGVLRISRCSARDCKSSARSNRRRSHRGVRQRSQRDSKSDRRNFVRLSGGCVGSDQACCFGKR